MSSEDKMTVIDNSQEPANQPIEQPLVTGYEIAVLTALENEPHGLSVTELVSALGGRLKSASAGVTCRRMLNKNLLIKRHGRAAHIANSGKRKPRLVYLISDSGVGSLKYWTLRSNQ